MLTTENTTGTHSYATKHEGFEIMFHVSTLLPHSAINRQQLERKRHIGNDVVVIVFQDGPNGGFNPKTISSKFNRILIRLTITICVNSIHIHWCI
jgi:hypothetical protein